MFLDFRVLESKFVKLLMSVLKWQVNSSLNFALFFIVMHISSVSWKVTPLYYCSSNNIYFGHKEPIKTNFLDFWVLRSKFVKFLTSILKRQVSSCSVFVSFFIVITHNSSVNLRSYFFYFGHQGSNFDTFECSGENLLNSSGNFPSNKSNFSLNFASLFVAMEDNCSLLF